MVKAPLRMAGAVQDVRQMGRGDDAPDPAGEGPEQAGPFAARHQALTFMISPSCGAASSMPTSASQRSASSAAMQPMPAEVTA